MRLPTHIRLLPDLRNFGLQLNSNQSWQIDQSFLSNVVTHPLIYLDKRYYTQWYYLVLLGILINGPRVDVLNARPLAVLESQQASITVYSNTVDVTTVGKRTKYYCVEIELAVFSDTLKENQAVPL